MRGGAAFYCHFFFMAHPPSCPPPPFVHSYLHKQTLLTTLSTTLSTTLFTTLFTTQPPHHPPSDECPDRGMLSIVLDVLLGVHRNTMTGWGAPHDVRAVLEAERRRVLAGVRLTFSRVIPLEQEPSSHPLWRLAEQFGATCSTNVGDDVTHVVAVTDGTDKVCFVF